jgi:putative ABC transport system permease protein
VRVTTADLGFERQNLLTVSSPPLSGTVADVIHTLETVPGVAMVGAHANGSAPLAMAGGFGGGASGYSVGLPGTPQEQRMNVLYLRTAPGYFRAAAISIIEGRDFQMDEIGRQDRMVIDVLTARRLFGDRSPVGSAVAYSDKLTATVVGVVATVLDRGPETDPNAMVYMPTRPKASGHLWLVRTAGDPKAVKPAVEAALNGLAAPGGERAQARALEDAFRFITAERRFVAGLMSIFGSFALIIGAAGIYGVMLAIVVQQTREFGIRLALGATAGTILTGVVAQAARLLLLGLAIGLPLGFALSRGVASVFYDVGPSDLSTYAIVMAITMAVGLIAAFLPARRAARVDPQITLRNE